MTAKMLSISEIKDVSTRTFKIEDGGHSIFLLVVEKMDATGAWQLSQLCIKKDDGTIMPFYTR